MELRKETKSTGRSGKYFGAVATPNREKPKEEEEEEASFDSNELEPTQVVGYYIFSCECFFILQIKLF